MPVVATVLIPTFNHGPTLRQSVGSVFDQTVSDLEIFIVGDGVPDMTREIVTELMSQDERIRFFDNPKGPRTGEIHRHRACPRGRGEEHGQGPDEGFPDEHRERPPSALAEELDEEGRGQDQGPRAREERECEQNGESEAGGGAQPRGVISGCVSHTAMF